MPAKASFAHGRARGFRTSPPSLAVSALSLALCLFAAFPAARGQDVPTTVQIFMPDGSRPPRELRFTITRDDGRIETLFTDSKGKYSLSGSLRRDGGYIITVEGDGRTFDTTTVQFRQLRGSVNYVPVFLKPYKGEKIPRAETVDSAESEEAVPAEARESYRRAMQAVGEGRAEEAVKDFKRALGVHPQYLRALSDLGVLYLRLNRLEEAADALRRAIKISKRFSYARLNLGIVLNRQGKFSEAVAVLAPLRREGPKLKGVTAAYADALAGAGDLREAESVLREASAAAGAGPEERVEAHYKLGMVLSRAGRPAEAAAELEKAVGLDEKAANAHLLLGGVLLELRRLPEAERELLRAYELGGSEAGGAQLLLGQLYLSQQKLEPALRSYEQYLRDVPAAPNAEKIREVIERIREALKKS